MRPHLGHLVGLILFLTTYVLGGDLVNYRDPIHGVEVRIPIGWSLSVFPRYVLITSDDLTRFLVFRVYKGRNLREAARSVLTETRLMARSWRAHFKRTRHGILIRADFKGYPYELDPMIPISWGVIGRTPPQDYTSLTYLIPLRRSSLVVSFYFPRDAGRKAVEEMVSVARTFRFTKRRIPSKRVVIRDPETGQVAATLRIPEGWDFAGTVLTEPPRDIYFVATKGDRVVRRDLITVSTLIQPMGQITQVSINGRNFLSQVPIVVSSFEGAVDLMISLWNSQGGGWRLVSREVYPKTVYLKALEEGFKGQWLTMARVYGMPADLGVFRGEFTARGSGLIRLATLTGFFMNSPQTATFSAIALTVQARSRGEAGGLMRGVLSGFRPDPEWFLSKMQRNIKDHAYWNRVILGVMRRHNEFLTRSSIAWTNILSEQTFVRDPETGEIFQVDLTGDHYWRDPIEGTIIGGVRELSELESLLRSRGWRKLDQSLEGFPEQWR